MSASQDTRASVAYFEVRESGWRRFVENVFEGRTKYLAGAACIALATISP